MILHSQHTPTRDASQWERGWSVLPSRPWPQGAMFEGTWDVWAPHHQDSLTSTASFPPSLPLSAQRKAVATAVGPPWLARTPSVGGSLQVAVGGRGWVGTPGWVMVLPNLPHVSVMQDHRVFWVWRTHQDHQVQLLRDNHTGMKPPTLVLTPHSQQFPVVSRVMAFLVSRLKGPRSPVSMSVTFVTYPFLAYPSSNHTVNKWINFIHPQLWRAKYFINWKFAWHLKQC